MKKQIKWLLPVASTLALAMVACGGAPSEQGNTNDESVAYPAADNTSVRPVSTQTGATNVGKVESEWVGWGYGYPFAWGYGAGWSYGYAGYGYGACVGWAAGCGYGAYGWGWRDQDKAGAPVGIDKASPATKLDVVKAEVER